MITIILTLILYANGVTADNCKNYAKKAEYNVFNIKAECGTKKCISQASHSRIKAYNEDLKKCDANIKSLKCQQKHLDPPVTPRTCTECDNLETKADVIIGQVKSAIYRKKCLTRGDMAKIQIYQKSFETCKQESAKLRCRQKIGKLPLVQNICKHAPTPTSLPSQVPTMSPASSPTEPPTESPTSPPTDSPTQPVPNSPTSPPNAAAPPTSTPPPEICSPGGNPCTNLQICAGSKCISTAVTFYQDIVAADQVGNVIVAQVGNGPVSITPARCVCYELEAGNGYSGLSFNFEPNQLATYTGVGCTGIVHTPHVIGVNNTCYNGTIGDPTVVSTDLYCDDFYIGESFSDFFNINDNLLSMEVCDILLPPSPDTPASPTLVPPPLPPPLTTSIHCNSTLYKPPTTYAFSSGTQVFEITNGTGICSVLADIPEGTPSQLVGSSYTIKVNVQLNPPSLLSANFEFHEYNSTGAIYSDNSYVFTMGNETITSVGTRRKLLDYNRMLLQNNELPCGGSVPCTKATCSEESMTCQFLQKYLCSDIVGNGCEKFKTTVGTLGCTVIKKVVCAILTDNRLSGCPDCPTPAPTAGACVVSSCDLTFIYDPAMDLSGECNTFCNSLSQFQCCPSSDCSLPATPGGPGCDTCMGYVLTNCLAQCALCSSQHS